MCSKDLAKTLPFLVLSWKHVTSLMVTIHLLGTDIWISCKHLPIARLVQYMSVVGNQVSRW